MDFLLARFGELALVFPTGQIGGVLDWPQQVSFPVKELPGFARASTAEGLERVLWVGEGAQRLGLRVPTPLLAQSLSPRALFRLPAVLKRMKPPSWIAGVAALESGLALVVDLETLSRTLHEEFACPR